MSKKHSNLKRRLNLIGAGILLAGLLGAALVYLTASDETSKATGYEIADGQLYPSLAEDTKRYLYEEERYGGKMAILLNEFNQWFSGLWKGRQLAYTLSLLATGFALACFLAAHSLSDPLPSGSAKDPDR